MAKSVRASVSKRNSVKRRDTIYKPVEDERIKRLSEKLLAIAEAKIPVDATKPATKKAGEDDNAMMDVVTETGKTASTSTPISTSTVTPSSSSTYRKKAAKGRISRHRHTRNAVVFPSLRKRQQRTGKRIGKGKKSV